MVTNESGRPILLTLPQKLDEMATSLTQLEKDGHIVDLRTNACHVEEN